MSSTATPPKGIQDYIYMLEEGMGRIILQRILFIFAGFAVAAVFLLTEARNFSNPEAMDMAQIGRNLASGKGFTTHYIRPFSLNLISQHARATGRSDMGILRSPHPDLEHPPVYPALLAGVFKITPQKYHRAIAGGEQYSNRPPMEIMVSILNLGFLAVATLLVYRLGTRLFESAVGKLAALAFVGTETIWRFATNGLATPLLLCLMLLIVTLLVSIENLGRDETTASFGARAIRALGLGLLLGIGAMTHYSFGWLIVPVVGFLLICAGIRRVWLVPITIAMFGLVVTPWIVRNLKICGHPFGTAGYTLYALTEKLPADRLERTQQPLQPDQIPNFESFKTKWLNGTAETLRNPLPRLGGNWLVALFLAGLLVQFQDVGRRRMHRFTLAALLWLFVVEPLCQTQLGQLVPVINSENLLILMLPLTLIFGAAFVAMLVDAIEWNHILLRDFAFGLVAFIVSLPLLTSLFPPRKETIIEPLYAPSLIKTLAGFLQPEELIMSDIPWAVAWYGDRNCVRISLRVQDKQRKDQDLPRTVTTTKANVAPEDFYQINDFQRPINALYLSPLITEAPLRLFFERDSDFAWGRFYFDVLVRKNAAGQFPLYHTYPGAAMGGHLFLSDRVRW